MRYLSDPVFDAVAAHGADCAIRRTTSSGGADIGHDGRVENVERELHVHRILVYSGLPGPPNSRAMFT
jgi:hypothetical protein